MNDDDFVALINESVPLWLEEFKDVIDKRLLWDLIKYRIRQITIKYSKEKARERRRKISDIEASLKISEERCGSSPTPENQEEFELLKMEYDSIYEQIAKGAIIRSKATWYEKGEKSNKFFLNLETHKKAKSSVRKVFDDNGVLITDPKKILQEIQNFYSKLLGDLISNKHELIIKRELRVLNLSLLDAFRLVSLIDALPTQWRESLKTCISTGDTPFYLHDKMRLSYA